MNNKIFHIITLLLFFSCQDNINEIKFDSKSQEVETLLENFLVTITKQKDFKSIYLSHDSTFFINNKKILKISDVLVSNQRLLDSLSDFNKLSKF